MLYEIEDIYIYIYTSFIATLPLNQHKTKTIFRYETTWIFVLHICKGEEEIKSKSKKKRSKNSFFGSTALIFKYGNTTELININSIRSMDVMNVFIIIELFFSF